MIMKRACRGRKAGDKEETREREREREREESIIPVGDPLTTKDSNVLLLF